MANTLTLINQTSNSATFTFAEAGTAAAVTTTDIIAALNAGALKDLLNQTFANQAAARTAWEAGVIVTSWCKTATPAGATGGPIPTVDVNVSAPAVASNLRLETNSVKAANGDTATYILRIENRHTISS